MVAKLRQLFWPKFKSTVEKTDFSLFVITVCLTLIWWWAMVNEIFLLNKTGFVTPFTATEFWQIWMAGYTVHKSVARWNGIELNGALWGRTFGAVTLIGGFLLIPLKGYFPELHIPEQLFPGMIGTAINITGWSAFKAIVHSRQNGKISIQIDPPDSGIAPGK